MLFSAKAEYACVAMLELAARHGEPHPVRLADVADKHGIPKPFLVQILLMLKGAGLVLSTRGAAGGYELAKAPDEITLYDVVQVMVQTDAAERAKEKKKDKLEPTVFVQHLRTIWGEVNKAQQELLGKALKRITLADVIHRSQGLQYVI